MSEVLRSARYHEERVLIETARVLNPQFIDGVLHITGAELELLRNLTAYLHRQSTFVSEYRDVDYLMPTVSDWDSLETIIADLEEKLMGNENVVWGYNDRYVEQVAELDADVNDSLLTTPVPAGETCVVQALSAFNNTNAFGLLRVTLVAVGVVGPYFIYQASPGAGVPYIWGGELVLKEDDFIRAYFDGNTAGDDLYLRVWGYKMKVPS